MAIPTSKDDRQFQSFKESTSSAGVVGQVVLNPDGSNISGGSGGGSGGVTATQYTGQATVGTSAVQVNSSSHTLTNGIIIKAPSTNAANIIVGLTGVTTTTGDIIEPGESRGYSVNNTNLLYIISPTSTSDIISYSAS